MRITLKTTPVEAASILTKRHGNGAFKVASNRCDSTDNYAKRCFYERVMTEIERKTGAF